MNQPEKNAHFMKFVLVAFGPVRYQIMLYLRLVDYAFCNFRIGTSDHPMICFWGTADFRRGQVTPVFAAPGRLEFGACPS